MRIEKDPMKGALLICSLVMLLYVTGCATPQYTPQIQTFGGLVKVKPQDLIDCKQWANKHIQLQEALPNGFLKGAFLGFALGAAANADRTATLLIGAFTGVNAAVSDADEQMPPLMQRCLKSRGYVVLQ